MNFLTAIYPIYFFFKFDLAVKAVLKQRPPSASLRDRKMVIKSKYCLGGKSRGPALLSDMYHYADLCRAKGCPNSLTAQGWITLQQWPTGEPDGK